VKAAVGFVLALASATLLYPLLQPLLAAPLFERENFRGRRLPVAAGLVIVLAVLTVISGWLVVDVLWDARRIRLELSLHAAAVATLGFGLLGLLDDLAGSGGRRGFRGHLEALSHGELTTGLVKLVGGGLVAIVAVAPWVGESFRQLVAGALVVALSANLANLLDRAPGRVGKASLLAFAALALTSRMAVALTGPAIIAGAGAGLLVPDVRERCMLGDTGANVLGAGAGLGLVLTTTPGAWEIGAVVLLALNLASEWVSFSRVIDRLGPLRWFDRLGAPPR
jgi:UDP-N-acetylmuramyl pentapeptide phosphotransferase/UDP-N-acetylglucosamine-1-phosphate transferase